MRTFRLTILPHELSIVRRSVDSAIPSWATRGTLFSVARTPDELSIVCETSRVPTEEQRSDGWRVFRVEGPFDFSEVGVIAALSDVLRSAGVSLFVFSTWDTDYILVRGDDVGVAREALEQAGHRVRNLQ